jgi:hypothetical protein
MKPSLESCPAPAPGVVGQIVQDEAVIVLPDSGEVKVLNDVGAAIWMLADGSRSVREIAAQVWQQYDVDLQQVEADALRFVAELLQRQMLILVR